MKNPKKSHLPPEFRPIEKKGKKAERGRDRKTRRAVLRLSYKGRSAGARLAFLFDSCYNADIASFFER